MLRCMPRTTIDLDDHLLRALKQRAAREGRTLAALVNELLQAASASRPGKPYRFRMAVHKGGPHDGLLPGVDLDDRDRLYDAMDEPKS